MPKLEEIPIGTVLEVLGPTYKSLDIRVIAVWVDVSWRLVAGIVVASRAELGDVQKLQEELYRRSRPPDSDTFHIRHQAVSSKEGLDGLLDDLDAGKLEVGGLTIDLEL